MIKKFYFQGENEGDVLYITDDVGKYASLMSEGAFVVPVITDDNKDSSESFSGSDHVLTDLNEILDAGSDKQVFIDGKDYIPDIITKIYQRKASLPWTILETKNLLVREMTVEDVDEFYRIYREPSITEFMEPLFDDPDDEKLYTRNYIKDIYGFYGFGLWTVIYKETGKVIGRAGISMRDGYYDPEIGFVIEKEYQNRGLAYEVCEAILRYARDELEMDTVEAFIMPENKNSLVLIDKLGFIRKDIVELNGTDHIRFEKKM